MHGRLPLLRDQPEPGVGDAPAPILARGHIEWQRHLDAVKAGLDDPVDEVLRR
jgi:hypothetical protein